MIEHVCSFGDGDHLTGVIAEPPVASRRNELPGVVFWNAGLLHHVGPHRLFVDLARALAQAGFVAMRFDLGGIGDSSPGRRKQASERRAVDEVREAMDCLATRNAKDAFVLVGLCSGALDAHRVMVADPRVCGAVLLDGYGYRTLGYYVRYYGPRMLSAKRWGRFVQRRLRRALGGRRRPHRGNQALDQLARRHLHPRRQVLEELQQLTARGVQLFYIYTRGVESYYNHEGQFRRMFAGLRATERIRVDYLPDADHLFTLIEARSELVRSVCAWTRASFEPEPGRD